MRVDYPWSCDLEGRLRLVRVDYPWSCDLEGRLRLVRVDYLWSCDLEGRLRLVLVDYPWSCDLEEFTGYTLENLTPVVIHLHKKWCVDSTSLLLAVFVVCVDSTCFL